MEKITFGEHSIEVDFLDLFNYNELYHWTSLKNCALLEIADLPKNVKSIVDFFNMTEPGYVFELERGSAIFGFKQKDVIVRGFRCPNSLYVYNGHEVAVYRNNEVLHATTESDGGYWKVSAILRQGFLEAGSDKFNIRHYRYLDMVLPIFSKLVKFVEPSCILEPGIITAHGDKCYQYEDRWNEAGVPFNRGTLLFLMTYTAIMDMEKSKSCEWVIKNYGRFRSILDTIEKSLGITDYLQEIQNVELLQPLYKSDGEAQSS